MEIIHVHIYEPHRGSLFGSTKKNKSKLLIYSCDKKDDCDAFKNGTCINVGDAFGSKCPIGKCRTILGFTQRAGKYYSQIRSWQEDYSQHHNALKPAPRRITKVAGGWMLPYSFIDMSEKVPFRSHSGLFRNGCPFLDDCDMNKEVVEMIINQRPIAMSGGVITDFQSKVVPKFIHDFSVYYPEKFKEVLGGNEKADEVLKSLDYVGRNAFLKTIKPNTQVKLGTNVWNWDGEKIFKNDDNFIIFKPCSSVKAYCEIYPDDEATVKITSNEQVDSNTKFAD